MGRKYSQHGYMDSNRDRDREKPRPQPKGPPKALRAAKDGPRSIRMPGFQEVLRCALCGAIVGPLEITVESQCPKCSADLRSCKNCRHFDTGVRFECTRPIPQRVTPKDHRNSCEFFTARTSIERETRNSSGGGMMTPADARSAFDNLFKK